MSLRRRPPKPFIRKATIVRWVGIAVVVVAAVVIGVLVWKDAPGLIYALGFTGVAALAMWWFGDF